MFNNDTDKKIKLTSVRCHGCTHFFITHEIRHPYGCNKFGFKAKKMPSQLVFETSGIQCAYKVIRKSAHKGGVKNQRMI